MPTRTARPLATLALLLPVAAAWAAEPPTLLGEAGYPAHQCSKPMLPMSPVGTESAGEIAMYNAQVRVYNQQAQTYSNCIQAYMNTANADIARIQARVEAAVSEANAR